MAIKINWENMYRRVYSWEDVQKVILNWAEIRPNEQPHIDYHVISNFTWWGGWWGGWLPWWWWWEWVEQTEDWVTPTWSSWTLTYSQSSWMPSLANAKRIMIVLNYDLDISELPTGNLVIARLWDHGEENLKWIIQYLGSSNIYRLWQYLWLWGSNSKSTESQIDGNYTTTIDVKLVNVGIQNQSILSTTWPIWFSIDDITLILPDSNFSGRIKASSEFTIDIKSWVTLKNVDFYIWNN